jgi:hypothetical protein
VNGRVAFADLKLADLVVDAVYAGGAVGNLSDDPIRHLLPVGNAGGVRPNGPLIKPNLVALVTSGEDLDWPDHLDAQSGVLTYYGDNKTGGKDLHDTPRKGNLVLRNLFDAAHGSATQRAQVAPVLVFAKTGQGRDHRFLGLAVPGSTATTYADDLTGIWRSKDGLRYQNYKAVFTVLDVGTVSRAWIEDIVQGLSDSENAPAAWLSWRNGGAPKALQAPRIVEHRTRSEQEPTGVGGKAVVQGIYDHFSSRPHDFEQFAADLVKIHLPTVVSLDVTRRSRDGGRDAIGLLRVGTGGGDILLDFSMEAKCYKPGSSVGVRERSRLISRLRHRQFGVLVTTSHLDSQAYKELKEDRHPIIVIAGGDIANIVTASSLPSAAGWKEWLQKTYPPLS